METFELPAANRFMLFAGMNYYPGPGMEDFIGFFASAELADAEALKQVKDGDLLKSYSWWHVFDLLESKIVSTTDDSWYPTVALSDTAKIWKHDDY